MFQVAAFKTVGEPTHLPARSSGATKAAMIIRDHRREAALPSRGSLPRSETLGAPIRPLTQTSRGVGNSSSRSFLRFASKHVSATPGAPKRTAWPPISLFSTPTQQKDYSMARAGSQLPNGGSSLFNAAAERPIDARFGVAAGRRGRLHLLEGQPERPRRRGGA